MRIFEYAYRASETLAEVNRDWTIGAFGISAFLANLALKLVTDTANLAALPNWAVVITLLAPAILFGYARLTRIQRVFGRCIHCGYMIRSLPENRCPECGRSFDPKRNVTSRVRPIYRPLVIGSVLLAVLPLLYTLVGTLIF